MAQQTQTKLKDPVCGMEVSSDSPHKVYYGNGYYYFCSEKDKVEFEKQPEKYVKEETGFGGKSCD